MRAMIAGLTLALLTGAAYAECGGRTGGLMDVAGWSIGDVTDDRFSASVDLVSQMKAPTRMIDAFIVFQDALGAPFWSINIPRDSEIPPGDPFTVERDLFTALASGRLLRAAKDDVSVFACVQSVVYVDGSIERFD
jgi:hypothetical protein